MPAKETKKSNIKIGISACLLGEQVRFDGGHKHHSYIHHTLGRFFTYHSFCPEVAIGLGIPREPIRIIHEGDLNNPVQRVLGTRDTSKDFTQKLSDCGNSQQEWVKDLCGYIFKKDSPSCGMERVKAYRNQQPTRKGVGLYAKQIMDNNPLLPCEEEGRLNDQRLRENFIERVYVYARWKTLWEKGITAKSLIEFHSRHKFIILSHNQKRYRELGTLVSNIPKQGLQQFAINYITQVMSILKKPSTRKNHINVLQHIQGYLRPYLDAEDKQELLKAIEDCRLKEAPLTIPRTLLRHHFRKNPNDYIANAYYLAPYPDELNF